MSSRTEQKEQTARAVLAAARAEFERVGFEQASLRSIAARAHVSAGTVLHYYGDKRELLHAALFADLEETLDRTLPKLGEGTLRAQLATLTRGVFAYYQKRPLLSRTLLKESLFAEGPWAARFAGQVTRVHHAIAPLADAAIRRGEVAATVNAPLLGMAYLSFFYFALMAWVQGNHDDPVGLVDRLMAQHLESQSPRGARKRGGS